MAQIDWAELKSEYATTDISYSKMAAKYGLSRSTLAKMAAAYKWTEARKKYREKLVTKTIDKISSGKADKLASMMNAADRMGKIIESILEDEDQFYRHVDQFGVESVRKKVDMKAVHELTGAMKDLTQVIRNVYNIPTEQESFSMKLARERLEIERRKVDGDDPEDDENTGVVLIPTTIPEYEDGGMDE